MLSLVDDGLSLRTLMGTGWGVEEKGLDLNHPWTGGSCRIPLASVHFAFALKDTMEITPKLKTIRVAQLDPGDLFIVRDETGSYVALAVREPFDGDRLVLLLGPPSSQVPEVPILTNFPSSTLVTSFGKDYVVRLPVDPNAWIPTEPQNGPCLVLSSDTLYVRGRYRQFN